jgi:Tfp pilus assembly protein PilP
MTDRVRTLTLGLIAALAVLPAAAQQKKKAEKQPAVKQQPQPAAKAEARQRAGEHRDPFIAVMRPEKPGSPAPAPPTCGPGVRSLIIGQTDFNGVVKAPAGMIAVVTANPGDRTYFLKEGTPLCNGRVVKITPDAVVFEEDIIDVMGKPAKREVIKRIPTEAK